MKRPSAWRPHPAGITRVVLGCGLLGAAPRIADQPGFAANPQLVTTAGRLVGLRHLVDGLALCRWRSVRLRRVVVGIDVVHGLSMVAVASGCYRLRRAASAAAVEAFGAALLTAVLTDQVP
jgi:hypothetical protein